MNEKNEFQKINFLNVKKLESLRKKFKSLKEETFFFSTFFKARRQQEKKIEK